MVIGKRLKSLVDRLRPADGPASPWRPLGAPYPLLAGFDPATMGVAAGPGLIAIWHLGVRPQWLKFAATMNLLIGLRSASQAQAILSYRPNGGVYVAWAPLDAATIQGSARSLIDRLMPTLQAVLLVGELDVPADAKPLMIPFPPGTVE